MGTYKPVKDANGNVVKRGDGTVQMAPTRRDPTSRELARMMQGTAQQQMATRNMPQAPGALPPMPQRASSQAPMPVAPNVPPTVQQVPPLPPPAPTPAVLPVRVAAPAPPAPSVQETVVRDCTSTACAECATAPAPKAAPKKRAKPPKVPKLDPISCQNPECNQGPAVGTPKVFRPYRKYEKFCCDECREVARKAKARTKYAAKKAAKAKPE